MPQMKRRASGQLSTFTTSLAGTTPGEPHYRLMAPLEHAMRRADDSRGDLARLGRWLTVEHEDLRPFVDEAVDWVRGVRQLPLGKEAGAGAEVHVEVPFAVRITESGWSPGPEAEWSPGSSERPT